ncbi:helix-turn-helix transcriptional regulator [Priestia flexa]|uniref:helix-turn-helix domain-containing protein n=1 Tax=Priestia flexa TaxID=86664 RepID=UPI003D2652F7
MTAEIKLRELMFYKGFDTIEKLHKKSGLSRKAISSILSGNKTGLRLETIIKLCSALDCKVEELIVIEKEKIKA